MCVSAAAGARPVIKTHAVSLPSNVIGCTGWSSVTSSTRHSKVKKSLYVSEDAKRSALCDPSCVVCEFGGNCLSVLCNLDFFIYLSAEEKLCDFLLH